MSWDYIVRRSALGSRWRMLFYAEGACERASPLRGAWFSVDVGAVASREVARALALTEADRAAVRLAFARADYGSGHGTWNASEGLDR